MTSKDKEQNQNSKHDKELFEPTGDGAAIDKAKLLANFAIARRGVYDSGRWVLKELSTMSKRISKQIDFASTTELGIRIEDRLGLDRARGSVASGTAALVTKANQSRQGLVESEAAQRVKEVLGRFAVFSRKVNPKPD